MSKLRAVRVIAGLSGLLVAATGLTGCMSPTYGTGTTAAEQLVDDLGAATTIGSDQSKKRNSIKYAPRPGLVVPAEGEQQTALVQPQASVADKESGQWVESPEEMRARLAEEAEANKYNTSYRSPLGRASPDASAQQLSNFRAARKVQEGNYEGRRYLSDPPPTYRQADPAALTDLGEPEKAKEKRRKKAATVSNGSSWWTPFQ
jgi:hypothetical protein